MRIEDLDDLREVRRLAAAARLQRGRLYRMVVRVVSSGMVILMLTTIVLAVAFLLGIIGDTPRDEYFGI